MLTRGANLSMRARSSRLQPERGASSKVGHEGHETLPPDPTFPALTSTTHLDTSAPGLCRRQREAVERAARERVAQAEDSAALQKEEVLSQEFELLLLQRKAQDQEKDVMQLEVDRLSRLVFELRTEKNLSEAEAQHLRSELKRSAQERVARDRKGGFVS